MVQYLQLLRVNRTQSYVAAVPDGQAMVLSIVLMNTQTEFIYSVQSRNILLNFPRGLCEISHCRLSLHSLSLPK